MTPYSLTAIAGLNSSTSVGKSIRVVRELLET